MKTIKRFMAAITLTLIAVAACLTPSLNASANGQSTIQSYTEDSAKASHTPGISASVTTKSGTEFYSYGYTDKSKKTSVDPNTFFFLGSVSKSYTGFAIMFLDERGEIDINEPITKYIPWLNFRLNGQEYSGSQVTIANFLYHTSGLTNKKHLKLSVMENSEDILEQNVRALVGADLAFEPSSQYEYGSPNYNVLAYLIETVTGKSFATFMTEEILEPLGLHENTLLFQENAAGNLAVGHKPAFFGTRSLVMPAALVDGSKSTGFILASSEGISRWLNIFSGKTYISDFWTALVKRALTPDTSVEAVDGSYYAAGWMITEDGSMIHHDGEVPGFNSRVIILPDEGVTISVLANSSSIFAPDVAKGINVLLHGGKPTMPGDSIFAVLDTITSAASIVLFIAICLLTFLIIRRVSRIVSNSHKFGLPTVKGFIIIGITSIVSTFAIVFSAIFPSFFGYFWGKFFLGFMSLAVPLAFILLSVTAILFFAHNTLLAISHKTQG
ncbi:serine hydrolase [Paenibacillus sp. MMS20-IR301]|uniref:serine hydrolase domain-containing protein n=1 Tax=Paenibacillus sp. MMS20-IR301 TaxID=2895946 RepID=UPI0028EFF906|nr:serine hydrolase [Paenibacillus sp. MMS20-IR301]WNS45190.1 serine hydrolase [Paenibacillus sp. MMS20-IR301]